LFTANPYHFADSEVLEFAGGVDRGDDAEALFKGADVVIDFSVPESTVQNAKLAAKYETAFVACTTGLSAEDEDGLKKTSEKTVNVYGSNTTVSGNVFFSLNEMGFKIFTDFCIGIV